MDADVRRFKKQRSSDPASNMSASLAPAAVASSTAGNAADPESIRDRKKRRKERKKKRKTKRQSHMSSIGGLAVDGNDDDDDEGGEGENEDVEVTCLSLTALAPAGAVVSPFFSTMAGVEGSKRKRPASPTDGAEVLVGEPAPGASAEKGERKGKEVEAAVPAVRPPPPHPGSPVVTVDNRTLASTSPSSMAEGSGRRSGATADVFLRERAERLRAAEKGEREQRAREIELRALQSGTEKLRGKIQAKETELAGQNETLSLVKAALSCHICMDLMRDPYLISPCGHSACYDCLKQWFLAPPPGGHSADDPLPPRHRPKSCPSCRATIIVPPTPVYVVRDLIASIEPRLFPKENVAAVAADVEEIEIVPPGPTVGAGGVWAGIFEGKLELRRVIRDEEDGVVRCAECGYEVVDGYCVSCGADYSGDEGLDTFLDDGDENDDEEAAALHLMYHQAVADDDGDENGDDWGDEFFSGGEEPNEYDREDSFLVSDNEIEESGVSSYEDSELSEAEEEDVHDQAGISRMASAIQQRRLLALGASQRMINRWDLQLHSNRTITCFIHASPSTSHPEDPERPEPFLLSLKHSLSRYDARSDPDGSRFVRKCLKASETGRAWWAKEKERTRLLKENGWEGAPPAFARRRGRAVREAPLASSSEDGVSEVEEIADIEKEESDTGSVEEVEIGSSSDEDDDDVERIDNRSGVISVERPARGGGRHQFARRATIILDSDDGAEEGGPSAVVEEVDDDDGTGTFQGRRKQALRSGFRTGRRKIVRSSEEEEEVEVLSPPARAGSSSQTSRHFASNKKKPAESESTEDSDEEEELETDASSHHSAQTKSGIAALRQKYGSLARRSNAEPMKTDDDVDDIENDPDGGNMLDDGGFNDEGSENGAWSGGDEGESDEYEGERDY